MKTQTLRIFVFLFETTPILFEFDEAIFLTELLNVSFFVFVKSTDRKIKNPKIGNVRFSF